MAALATILIILSVMLAGMTVYDAILFFQGNYIRPWFIASFMLLCGDIASLYFLGYF